MTKMKRAELEKYRRLLQVMEEDLVTKIRRASHSGREEQILAEPSDSGDVALASYTKEFWYKLSDVERVHFNEIQAALLRIKDDTYGECIDCEEPVPPKRLAVVPWASRCTACQEKFETSQEEDLMETHAQEAANF
jgi:DnaK suppressor protein